MIAWGSIGFKKGLHNNLQKLNAKAMSASQCRAHYQTTQMPVHVYEFCTLITQGTGTCNVRNYIYNRLSYNCMILILKIFVFFNIFFARTIATTLDIHIKIFIYLA